MNRRGWIGWIERNPVVAAVFSFVLGLSLAATGFLAAEVGVGGPTQPQITDPAGAGPFGETSGGDTTGGDTTGGDTTGTSASSTTTTGDDGSGGDDAGAATTSGGSTSGGSTTAGSTAGGSTTGSPTTGGSTSGGSTTTGGSTSGGSTTGGSTATTTGGSGTDGSTGTPATCEPDPDYTMTGITPDEIVIGQITSEVQQLPQQFAPVRQGLEAYLKQLNDRGGICGRTVRLQHRNDMANPTSTRSSYQQLAGQVFVFVGNTSLQDGQMYQGSKPFDPIASDNGEYLPDVGGFGLSYVRTQSPWFAGPLGSVSPTLVGGTAFVGYAEELAAEGRSCEFGGVLYLNEPTGASQDQAQLGAVSIEAPWGMNLGPDSTQLYGQQLAASTAQYRLTVQQMLNDGVDCVFTYADLQSNVNLVRAAADEGAWPRSECLSEERCLDLIYQPFAGYEPSFIGQLGADAMGVHTFVPHLPFEETGHPTMQRYLADLEAVNSNYLPSTFSVVGYASGAMFETLMTPCGAAPTRACIHEGMFALRDWSPDGLTGPITPFRTSRATWDSPFGEYDFKWIFNCSTRLRVQDVGGELAWKRSGPAGYECGDINVARSR